MTDRNLTSQGAERKQQLLDAAARLFAEQGYSATRVVDIVDAAGVAKGLFYWYFENKEAVFRELATNIRQRLRRHQRAAMDADAPALTRLVQGSVGPPVCSAIALVMSPCSLILPAMNACMPACGLLSTIIARAVS